MFDAHDISYYLASLFAVAIILTVHEFSHAFVAHLCGDDTAKYVGRMTLNPFAHFDILGIIMFAIVGFGWAKPVPVNPYNFKDIKTGSILTSAAGVIANVLMAFLICPLYMLAVKYIDIDNFFSLVALDFLGLFFIYNLNFFVFNLIPLYPLDGFRVWDALDEKRSAALQFVTRYGYRILLGLIIWSFICERLEGVIPFLSYLDILGHWLRIAVTFIADKFILFWSLIIK